ncbi:MAG: bifunctional phosphopantothenoylcysteine decarboxylase/phosphopantothenate--cysteine ligase CoaBC [Bacteroidetes bacterium]|nr:bifunctional phosphopantothenoylcysteine decarboxylase/phosphopantothenate--cysteine ligase CoaBC [Bacteroidota bacterium]
MKVFQKKKIIVGVSGGIAAYKSCYLIRELIKLGAEVKVVMTSAACEFVTPLTFSTLSQNEVIVDIFPKDRKSNLKLSTWHIELSMWADLLIFAPATVNSIAKINYGIADNALTTLISALRCPLLIAPAADEDMFESEANRRNISELKAKGIFFVDPGFGDLASGLVGKGRLAEVENILVEAEKNLTNSNKDFSKKKVLISSGPTFEPIDPVRYIGNRSSGRMGQAVALAAFYRGADVTVVTGPTQVSFPKFIKVVYVRTADEMYKEVTKQFLKCDIFISAAAVSDFKPKNISTSKIKKDKAQLSIQLERTKDILREVSRLKKKKQIVVGFSIETEDEIKNSKNKLSSKNLDMIVINNPLKKGAGFEVDTNQIAILKKNGKILNYSLKSKFEAANDILDQIKN